MRETKLRDIARRRLAAGGLLAAARAAALARLRWSGARGHDLPKLIDDESQRLLSRAQALGLSHAKTRAVLRLLANEGADHA